MAYAVENDNMSAALLRPAANDISLLLLWLRLGEYRTFLRICGLAKVFSAAPFPFGLQKFSAEIFPC